MSPSALIISPSSLVRACYRPSMPFPLSESKHCMAMYGCVYMHVYTTMYCYVCMAMYGCVYMHVYTTMYCYVCMAMYGCVWLCMYVDCISRIFNVVLSSSFPEPCRLRSFIVQCQQSDLYPFIHTLLSPQ